MDKVTQQQTPGSAHAAFTMAALTSIGGIIGFVQKRSVPSALSGLTLGAVFAYAGSLITRGETSTGHQVACGASVVTGAAMSMRLNKSKKLASPAAVVLPAAMLSAVYHAWKASAPQ